MAILVDPLVPPPPAAAVVTSPDGFLTAATDPAHAGTLLRADFSALDPWPSKVTFLRDGVPILSGDPAWAPEGRAVAYDYFAPLGVVSVYTAQPVGGVASQGAGVALPDLDCKGGDVWVKSVANPALSLRLSLRLPNPSTGTVARVVATDVPGAQYPSVAWGRRGHTPVTLTLRTSTHEEYYGLETLLDAGPVLIQPMRAYGIRQFYAIPMDTETDYLVMATDPRRNTPVPFQPINPPSTVDSPLYIPGRSWGEVGAQWTWQELGDAFTWDTLMAPA